MHILKKKNIILITLSLLVPLMFLYGYYGDKLFKEQPAKTALNESKKIYDSSANKTDEVEKDAKVTGQLSISFSEDYWDEWKKEDKMARFEVGSVDLENNTFEGVLTHPTNHTAKGVSKSYTYNCSILKSVLTFISLDENSFSDDFTYESNHRYLDLLKPGSVLYAFCLSDTCDQLGDECILEVDAR